MAKIYRPGFSFEAHDASRGGYVDGALPMKPRVFAYGNSIVYGVNASDVTKTSWPAVMRDKLQPRWEAKDWIGRSGWNTAQLRYESANDLAPYNTATEKLRTRRVMVFLEATNDLGIYPQTTPDYAQFTRDRVAEGWDVILCTCMPTTSTINPGTLQTSLLAFNAEVRAQYKSWGAIDILDIGAEPAFQDPTGPNFSDGVHLSDAGYAILGAYAAARVDRYYIAGPT